MRQKNKMLLLMSVVLIFSAIYINIAKKTTKPLIIKEQTFERIIEDIEHNTEYNFRYDIEAKGKEEEKASCQISIYGVNSQQKETLLNTIKYYSPKGIGNLVFKTLEDTKKIKIQIEPKSNLKDAIKMMSAELIDLKKGERSVVMVNYKYLPKVFEKYGYFNNETKIDKNQCTLFVNKMLYDKYKSIEYSDAKSKYFNGEKAINLSNKILFLGSILEQIDTNKVKIKFRFKCIGNMDINYGVYFNGRVIDNKIISKERQQYGFENWDHSLPIQTSDWQIGKVYEDEKIINIYPGQYDLQFGLWNSEKNPKTNQSYRLYPNIDLGWIQILQ